MDILWEIIGEILDILIPSRPLDRSTDVAGLGCALVFIYIVMMCATIGMGIWVLPINKPAGIALIIVGALLAIGTLIAFLKFFFRRNK